MRQAASDDTQSSSWRSGAGVQRNTVRLSAVCLSWHQVTSFQRGHDCPLQSFPHTQPSVMMLTLSHVLRVTSHE